MAAQLLRTGEFTETRPKSFPLIKQQSCRMGGTLVRLVDEVDEGKYLLSIIGLN